MKVCIRLALLTFGLMLMAGTKAVYADDDAAHREYEVKAALIYKIAQFTQWPDKAFSSDSDPIVFATVGADPFSGSLETIIGGKMIGNHPITIQHFPDADHLGRCHVLFVAPSLVKDTSVILRSLSQAPVLTVADADGFCEAGGVLQLYIEDSKIHFEINTDAAERACIKISSRLLKLAKVYKQS